MAELSHRALRELIEGFGGCDEYFTEMISAGALMGGGPFEAWYIEAGPCPGRLVYQLAGNRPEQIAPAAALLDKTGAAGIDINMGCSAPAIVRTGAGVRWMASIDRAGELVRQVRKGVKGRLSVKLRIGLEDNFDYLTAFCRRLEAEGVNFITLHPRTAGEKFKRQARWEYVSRLRRELGIPVAGNGDIEDAADLVRRARGDWDAVMAGRAAVRAPWIFAWARALEALQETPPPAVSENSASRAAGIFQRAPAGLFCPDRIDLEDTGLRFLDLLARYQPPEFHLSRAHRFFFYFCNNLKWANYVKNLLGRETTLSGMAGVWSAYFRERPEERDTRI
jgi:tRNA-dihydrouridine synthase